MLHFLTTGGTFDKRYGVGRGVYNFYFPEQTSLYDVLRIMRVTMPYGITQVMRKDSLDMGDTDRKVIAQQVLDSSSSEVVVVHGTDTMIETARVIATALCVAGESETDTVVVLTGASLPACDRDTDAYVNVALAVGAVQSKPPGVYIAMNGRVFNHRNCIKRDDGTFASIAL